MSRIKEVLLLHVIFPVADFVMGTKAMHWYRKIKMMNDWSTEEIDIWQTNRLKELVQHAYNHTVYYKEVFDSIGLKPEDIQTFDDLKKLPVLTKEIIKARFEDIKPDNIQQIKHRFSSTGGSTGDPLRFLLDENTWGFVTAAKINAWKSTGYHYGDLYVSLGSSSLFPVNKRSRIHEIYYRIRNTIPLNGMNMEDAVCKKYTDIILENKAHYLYGYASSIYLLALYVQKNSIQLDIKGVYSTSEVLTDAYRRTIESTFNVRVLDCYGARDGGITAYEVTSGFYNVSYNTFCETKDENTLSKLYCTNLIDFAFPFIRYELGDEVLLDKDSDNQYNGQTIKKIGGRSADIIHLSNGKVLTNPGFTILFKAFNIEAYRVEQLDTLALKVRIQKMESFEEHEEYDIIAAMKKHAGEDCEIVVEYVTQFEPLKNGKRSFFMNSKA